MEGGPDGSTKPYLVLMEIDRYTIRRIWDPSSYRFTLPSDEPMAADRTYPGVWTVLPCELANRQCDKIEPFVLLKWLNTIFGTSFIFSPEAEACISEFIDDGCDLGTVYGYLRPWWHSIGREEGFEAIRSTIRARMEEDYKLRAEAVVGSHVTRSSIPPRRVWDLYSNRVLPYYAIEPGYWFDKTPRLPDNLWAVSHSWRPASERQSVLTTINGKAWHVPIPKGTTLNAIRDELLILGAEYVFLDVLCLRQKDESLPEMEGVRKREWRLDIPTIGHVYNEEPTKRPVVVYFNGLGLPFRDQPLDPGDRFHWFNRIWTLQETPEKIIFGGMKHKKGAIQLRKRPTDSVSVSSLIEYRLKKLNPSTDVGNKFEPQIAGVSQAFIHQLGKSNVGADLSAIVDAISSRTCSNPVDEVACLAYLLRCPKLPIYDADTDVEVAWSLLVECMSDKQRGMFLYYDFDIPGMAPSASWYPTWRQVKAGGKLYMQRTRPLQHLDSSSPSLGYKHGFDAYYHTLLVMEGCYVCIPRSQSQGADQSAHVRVPSVDGAGDREFGVAAWGQPESTKPSVPYLLISTAMSLYWVVAQVIGSRRIGGTRGVEVRKLSILEIPGMFDLTQETFP